MRYVVTRTSMWDDTQPPCDGVEPETVTAYTYYTFKTVAEAAKRYPNHPFEKCASGVRSQRGAETAWFLSVDTIDELMEFIAEHGVCVIGGAWWRNHEFTELEIYDDYRE